MELTSRVTKRCDSGHRKRPRLAGADSFSINLAKNLRQKGIERACSTTGPTDLMLNDISLHCRVTADRSHREKVELEVDIQLAIISYCSIVVDKTAFISRKAARGDRW